MDCALLTSPPLGIWLVVLGVACGSGGGAVGAAGSSNAGKPGIGGVNGNGNGGTGGSSTAGATGGHDSSGAGTTVGGASLGGAAGSGGGAANAGTGGGTANAGTGGDGGSSGADGQPRSCGTVAGTDIWNLPTFQVAAGPYKPDWKALGQAYSTPQWWRDAKFGAWAHWDPQSMPEQGDWYALRMYQQGSADYNYHLSHFGDPSEYGYKDICKNWVIDQWDPSALMDLYVQMGAKFFMAMGSHHDNFDNWDSSYQPWNSVRVGVNLAKRAGLDGDPQRIGAGAV